MKPRMCLRLWVNWVLCGPLLMPVSRWSSLFVHLVLLQDNCELDQKIFHLCWAWPSSFDSWYDSGLWIFVVCAMHLTTFLGCSASSLYWYYIAICVLGWGGWCVHVQSTTDLFLYAFYMDKIWFFTGLFFARVLHCQQKFAACWTTATI
jgi:hypothetical protein